MRHQRHKLTLGVQTKHRKALLRNLVKSLVVHKRIQTTYAKAKAASALADQMVQIAKQGDLSARRLLISRLGCSRTAHAFLTQIAPHFQSRQGGYTRVLKISNRVGDGAQTALLEFTAVMEAPVKKKKEPKKAKKEKPHIHDQTEPHAPQAVKEKEEKKATESKKAQEKKESEKKGGFLGALRKFLKGDDQ
ncbi:MAG: 50S ribosomal protein L17 [Candidatus Omnitrophica bacterium]|nr:50S ribosomal protein L17 [Candidatus Omnitrophota bacterium]